MYPDQVQRIRRDQEARRSTTDAVLYRRRAAQAYLATRYRFLSPEAATVAAVESWVLNGGRRPWGM